MAAADQPRGHQFRRGAADHRVLPPALDHRAIDFTHDEDQGLRHRGLSCGRRRTIREACHRHTDRRHRGAEPGARTRWRSRAAMTDTVCSRPTRQPIIAAVSTSLEGLARHGRRKPAHARQSGACPHGSAPGSAAGPALLWQARTGGHTAAGMLRLQADDRRASGSPANVMARARPPHEDHDIETELQTLLSAAQ